MNKHFPLLLLSFLFLAFPSSAQVGYSAHDTIPAFEGQFRYGANMGAYYFWRDEELADIAAGNPELGVEGIGVNALRPSLSEVFLEFWGYDIRIDAFRHYDKLGIKDNVIFIGYPNEEHRDPTSYCPGVRSELFANMYEPIWDNGENGTPVNEENYYASYLWKMVSQYTDYVKYWEIWNEPDFDFIGKSSRQPGEDGNWWEHDPDPCEYAIHAPVEHYIRLLRISYEVIKTISPDDYVTLGGIGYPSFLDILLRNTDNPDDGKIDSLYPLRGGAYFDVVSYHSYPHIDNSLRAWSDEVGGFVHFRHSDKCVDGMLSRQVQMKGVLKNRGYDGTTFPAKRWIITESNIPRVQVDEFLGSDAAQRNYTIKALVACQQNEIDQYHIYQLGDIRLPDHFSEFHSMGVFLPLDSVPKYEQQVHDVGIAYKTTSDLLKEKIYDQWQTANLQLPDNIKGGAFRDASGNYTYVLWAVTETDRSEKAAATYTFPTSFNLQNLHLREWDFATLGITRHVRASSVELTGSPRFFTDSRLEFPAEPVRTIGFELNPNPFSGVLHVRLNLPDPMVSSLALYDMQGRQVSRFFTDTKLAEGEHLITLDSSLFAAGMYVMQFEGANGRRLTRKVVKN